jgi:hypothetical protein
VERRIVLGTVAVLSLGVCGVLAADVVRQGEAQASYSATILAAVTGVVAAAAAVWALVPRTSRVPLAPELVIPDWLVERPAELGAVVKALVRGRTGTVGITTGLYGAGGFGKTTLARAACADRRVRKRFKGRAFLVPVGRDLRGPAAISAKVNDVIKLVAGAGTRQSRVHAA